MRVLYTKGIELGFSAGAPSVRLCVAVGLLIYQTNDESGQLREFVVKTFRRQIIYPARALESEGERCWRFHTQRLTGERARRGRREGRQGGRRGARKPARQAMIIISLIVEPAAMYFQIQQYRFNM